MIGRENQIHQKSRHFAVRIVKMVAFYEDELSFTYRPMLQQVMKSGTSIGANIRESQYAESTEDFVHKLKIALKEANETEYWLDILHEADIMTEDIYESMIVDCKELLKLLIAIINKTNDIAH
ncbi:MAG: four helix bundle protein [Paludibacteraceae bacterium]|nr:four helix bundle protein [Paludibacteraceae bacterium]